MKPISSKIENQTYLLYDLEQKLKPLGYVIGGNWDYDHGYFDYKIADNSGYQFLRVPFKAIDGQLDSNGATVSLGRPFLLAHQYESGLDDHAGVGNFAALTDQFSEPENKDANVPEKYIEIGQALVAELESVLM
ncbi:YugN-like family protein [Calidifontibacillus oryziterrae]|uniref:YugN-like family protein n=1 Tax=Calidifontibacillus oryziterrae TaxID=1191699 RepID=UPI000313B91A|nr:YugN-like family protein [Calidifontibacillus oryziterrae]